MTEIYDYFTVKCTFQSNNNNKTIVFKEHQTMSHNSLPSKFHLNCKRFYSVLCFFFLFECVCFAFITIGQCWVDRKQSEREREGSGIEKGPRAGIRT